LTNTVATDFRQQQNWAWTE